MSSQKVPTIAEALRAAVDDLGTQRAVAAAIGANAVSVSRWLLGIAPEPLYWDAMMKLFGVSREQFGLMVLATLEERAERRGSQAGRKRTAS